MFKKRLSAALNQPEDKLFWLVNDVLAVITLLAAVMVVAETAPSVMQMYGKQMLWAEYLITLIFSLEYAANIYVAKSKRAYIFSFYGIVDLLAILPTFLMLTSFQFLKVLRITRLLRLLRMMRLLKMVGFMKKRYNQSKAAREMLRVNVTIYVLAFALLTLVFSVILYEIEHNVPNAQITSIGNAMWTTVSALSSVGYGDTFPISGLGRFWLAITMFVGVGFLSFAVMTLGRFFQEVLFGENLEG